MTEADAFWLAAEFFGCYLSGLLAGHFFAFIKRIVEMH